MLAWMNELLTCGQRTGVSVLTSATKALITFTNEACSWWSSALLAGSKSAMLSLRAT